MSNKVKAERVSQYRAKKGENVSNSAPSRPKDTKPADKPRPVVDIPPVKKLFVHIKDPDDHDSLVSLKKICGEFTGNTDIVLVLGADKKSAIKLPFKVDGSDGLVGELVKLLGEDAVVLK